MFERTCVCARAQSSSIEHAHERDRLRTHSHWQWSRSCASTSVYYIDMYAIYYLTRMVLMQILRMYVVRRACSRRASPEDSTDKPTMARGPSKRLGEYLYGYI